jgi:hypothetical protein
MVPNGFTTDMAGTNFVVTPSFVNGENKLTFKGLVIASVTTNPNFTLVEN